MKNRILLELQRIEREFSVRVLFAVESGSRAWGFASPDSDYDVRFIYCHPKDWYLSVFENRDVIEQMLPDALDVSGWDLRKALRLFPKCNLALNEWFGSPIVYSEIPEFRAQIAPLVPQYFNPIAGMHHYRRMAESSLTDNLVDNRIRIKKLFYVLRPLLACRWIEKTDTQPPTEFGKLVAASWVSDSDRAWIGDLQRKKTDAAEAEPVEVSNERIADIQAELERYKAAAELVRHPERIDTSTLDEVLRRWVA